MNLEWYKTFIVAAKYQNYHQAAEELFITQTTVFNHIKHLEERLNVKLFERSCNGVKLTSAGSQFYRIANQSIATVESGIDTIRTINSEYSMQIKVAVSTYVASYLIPKFLPLFFQEAPYINISISVVDMNLSQKIIDNTYDIGINRELPNTNKLYYKNICEGKIRLIVPNCIEDRSFKTEVEYFQKYRILCNNHPVYWEKLQESIYEVYPNAKFISISSVHATENMIHIGQGVSYLPLYILKNRSQNTLKCFDSIKIPAPISFTYMMWYKENEAVTTFIDIFSRFIRNEQT